MGYIDLLNNGASSTEVRSYLSDGPSTAITIRIPANLKEATAEAAELYGMSFSAFIRGCLIEKLSKKEAQR